MLIYLDMCSLQRPLADKPQLRVRLEAEAVLGIISFRESGQASLVSSDALDFEDGRNPHPVRRAHPSAILGEAQRVIRLSPEVERRAESMIPSGLKALDALHLSCAVEAGADFFRTCDDRLPKRARAISTGTPKIVSPLELVAELES